MSGANGGETLDRRRFRLLFALIVLTAGLIRVGYVIVATADDPLVGDQIYYSAQAVAVADGRGFEHPFTGEYAADHVPLTALALAPVSWSDDHHILPQRLAMAIYGTGVVVAIGLLARSLLGRRPTLVAVAISATYANLWMNDGVVMAETLATATIVFTLLATYWYHRRPTWLVAVAAGSAVGLAGLARAELLLLGPAMVAPMILATGRRNDRRTQSIDLRQRLVYLALAAAASCLVIAPWVGRNQIRFEESTWMSTQDGLTLLGANCPESYGGDGLGFWILQCADRVVVAPDADQSEVSAAYRRAAVDFIGDNVDRIPVVVAARLGRGLSVWRTGEMVDLNIGEGREPWASRIGLLQFWTLAPLAVFGLRSWRGAQPRWPLLIAAGSSILLIMAAYGIPRFRVAAEVAIVIGAAAGIDTLWRNFSEQEGPPGTVRQRVRRAIAR